LSSILKQNDDWGSLMDRVGIGKQVERSRKWPLYCV